MRFQPPGFCSYRSMPIWDSIFWDLRMRHNGRSVYCVQVRSEMAGFSAFASIISPIFAY